MHVAPTRSVLYDGGMQTEKRTEDTPWQCINVMTDECVGWFDTDIAAYTYAVAQDIAVSVIHRPKRKKVTK